MFCIYCVCVCVCLCGSEYVGANVSRWSVCKRACVFVCVYTLKCFSPSHSQRYTKRGRGWGGRGYGKEVAEAE